MNSLLRPLRRFLRRRHALRVWTLLIGLCYLVLSVFLPFQHTHCVGEVETEFIGPTAMQIAARNTDVPSSAVAPASYLNQSALKNVSDKSAGHKFVTVKAAKSRSAHCLACEWQAMQISAALPAFKLFLTASKPERVVTTLPRYLRSRTVVTASRGPPAV